MLDFIGKNNILSLKLLFLTYIFPLFKVTHKNVIKLLKLELTEGKVFLDLSVLLSSLWFMFKIITYVIIIPWSLAQNKVRLFFYLFYLFINRSFFIAGEENTTCVISLPFL